MPSDLSPERGRDRRASIAVALTAARRAVRSAAVWGLALGWLVMNEALGYHRGFPTVAARTEFARTFGDNSGLAAVVGPGRRLDTIEGFVAWRMFGLLIIVGAVWGLLTATRLLRGEEDAGRWELLLAGRTTRRRATVQVLAGLAVGYVTLWALVAGFTVAAGLRPRVGFPVGASLFYATAATASAALFLAVGALTSQLATTRRQANGLGAAVLAVCFLVRMLADSGLGLEGLRWASPLGWIEELRPLTGSQPLALVPVVLLVAATAAAAVVAADRRDVGAGLLARAPSTAARTRLLEGPARLALRLERWVALGWVVSLALLALVFGVVARSAAAANLADSAVAETVGRLGGRQTGAAAWIGYEFLFLAALLAVAATTQVSALRGEEATGRLDNLLARPLRRTTWLAGRLGVAAALVAVAGLVSGVGGWIGIAAREGGVGLGAMLQAGANIVPPAIFVLGLGTLLYGLAPRLAAPALHGLVAWSFVVQILGSGITTNRWVLDTAVFSHLGPVPAASLDWTAVAWLVGLGVAAAVGGLAAFGHRDLVSE